MLPISRQLSLDRELPGVASNPRLYACTWTRVPGANSHTAPTLARVSVLYFLSTLSLWPPNQLGEWLKEDRLRGVYTPIPRGDAAPSPKGGELEPGESQLLGSPIWLCPLPARETWVKFTKHLGTWFPHLSGPCER